MTDKHAGDAETIGGGFKAINYVMSIARQVGARKLSASCSLKERLQGLRLWHRRPARRPPQ